MSENQDTLLRVNGTGGNQTGLRDRNARLVLSLIRRQGALSGAEIARRSSLTAQTVSNILRALENDGLLKREEAVKGRVGKPSVPMSLNPEGVFSLGLNIGRRSAELVLVDFTGTPVAQKGIAFPYPEIDAVFDFLRRGTNDILIDHPAAKDALAGLGVGLPYAIWSWLEVVDAREEAMRAWKDFNLAARVRDTVGLEATIRNDATSACIAEHLRGRGNTHSNFAYIFIGAFIGGGLVLDDKVISGPTGNAAGIADIRVPTEDGGVAQLLQVASLHVLEHAINAAGLDPDSLRGAEDWSGFDEWVEPWIDRTARNLAIAAVSIAAVVEIEAVLIDGAMPSAVRKKLVDSTRRHIEQHAVTGIQRPSIEDAVVGRNARSIGAALLPIHTKYFLI